MDEQERRRHQRHNLKLEVTCRKIGQSGGGYFTGRTLNISTGGLLAHTSNSRLKVGDFLNVQLCVPPTSGLLEYGGRLEGFAKVIRVNTGCKNSTSLSCSIAVQFCSSPKLSV